MGVNFVEAESLIQGNVPPETKGEVLQNFPRDRMDLEELSPLPTLLGVDSLKTKELKSAHDMYLLDSWSTQLPLYK